MADGSREADRDFGSSAPGRFMAVTLVRGLRRRPHAEPGGERVPAPGDRHGRDAAMRVQADIKERKEKRGQHNWVPGAAKRPAPRVS
ncbi:hypothetical protein OG840_02125 [Streptomyces sp. NBC_01764]|uniref:hypothetical protein n=1 Tax=Streptomyces sp. NBC_01764 TaxID=2975935 RepID=UPI002250C56E|nr:hypothetical protein [Streptomyces sp. NBC_01764]MCX4400626.1 hypothetical protein [Streptomyces sp. NBC_01764]